MYLVCEPPTKKFIAALDQPRLYVGPIFPACTLGLNRKSWEHVETGQNEAHIQQITSWIFQNN